MAICVAIQALNQTTLVTRQPRQDTSILIGGCKVGNCGRVKGDLGTWDDRYDSVKDGSGVINSDGCNGAEWSLMRAFSRCRLPSSKLRVVNGAVSGRELNDGGLHQVEDPQMSLD